MKLKIMQFYCRMNLKLDLSCSLSPDWPLRVLFVKLFIAIFQSATNISGEIIKLETSRLAGGRGSADHPKCIQDITMSPDRTLTQEAMRGIIRDSNGISEPTLI